MDYIFSVSGMSCNACKSKVTKIAQKIPGVQTPQVDLRKGVLSFESEEVWTAEKLSEYFKDTHYQIFPFQNQSKVFMIEGEITDFSKIEVAFKEISGITEVNKVSEGVEIVSSHPVNLHTLQNKLNKISPEALIYEEGKKEEALQNKTEVAEGTIYYCPMMCEGDKTYDAPGDCPVCGMDLIPKSQASYSNTLFTCPMHPEIEEEDPGDCPICGMELIPKEPEVEGEQANYLKL